MNTFTKLAQWVSKCASCCTIIFFINLLLTLGVGNMWGADMTYNITWKVNGENAEGGSSSVAAGDKVSELPETPDACSADLIFVGWSDQEVTDGNKPAVLFTDIAGSPDITDNVTFYSVFAEKGTEKLTHITGGDWSNGATADWTIKGTETYSGNGVKFDSEGDYVLSPDISSKGYLKLLLKFSSGCSGVVGSKLTFYAYNKNGTLLTDENVSISPKTIEPSDTYNSQKTIYQVSISASEVIGSVVIQMTSKISNLGMKYCEIFGVSSSFQNYTTSCGNGTAPVYTRGVTLGDYGTICVPYGSDKYSGAEFYEVSSLVVGQGLWLDQLAEGTPLEAGKPYIFKATTSELTIIADGTTVDAPQIGANGLTGTFTDIAAGGNLVDNYIIAENKVWVAGTGATLPANRAYINSSSVPTTPQAQIPGRRRVCMGENAATGFDNITTGENHTIKFIENGQLIIIRDGVKYNAQGQRLSVINYE